MNLKRTLTALELIFWDKVIPWLLIGWLIFLIIARGSGFMGNVEFSSHLAVCLSAYCYAWIRIKQLKKEESKKEILLT